MKSFKCRFTVEHITRYSNGRFGITGFYKDEERIRYLYVLSSSKCTGLEILEKLYKINGQGSCYYKPSFIFTISNAKKNYILKGVKLCAFFPLKTKMNNQ